tara:strand:+ start:1827 stop:2450 length:624 start_codon:yes stop_codon:yes gene_type:complete
MIGILDLNVCNLQSIFAAIYNLGHDTIIVGKNDYKLEKISHLVIPGVGSYSNISKEYFSDKEFDENLKSYVKSGKPLLGICLGMQFLSSYGYENGKNEGLNFIDAKVEIMQIDNKGEFNLPHIGWNEIEIIKEHKIFHKIKNLTNFYFVHSYQMNLEDENLCYGKTEFYKKFTSVVIKDNIVGFQFHPEKSSKNGLKILNNFLTWKI